MNAPLAFDDVETWTLRVLNGRLAGAERRLHAGKYLSVGHGLHHDIVLRGTRTAGISLELHIADDQARVKVVSGEIVLLGRPVPVGETAILPPYVPLHVGEYAVAIGHGAEDRWSEAERLGQAVAVAHAPAEPAPTERAGMVDRLTTRLYPLHNQVTAYPGAIWAIGAAGALLLSVALFNPVADLMMTSADNPKAAQSYLAGLGYTGVTVTQDQASNTLIISGMVKTERDAAQLRDVAAQRFGNVLVDVTTMAALAAAATDILSSQKVDAVAKPGVRNSLVIEAEYLPVDRQAELSALLKRDLPALQTVSFRMDDRRGDRDLQYFFSSSTNGLATYVDGAPGYIVTVDQARWFEGSTVPTGHKILSIGNGRIIFERNGQLEELLMLQDPQPQLLPQQIAAQSVSLKE